MTALRSWRSRRTNGTTGSLACRSDCEEDTDRLGSVSYGYAVIARWRGSASPLNATIQPTEPGPGSSGATGDNALFPQDDGQKVGASGGYTCGRAPFGCRGIDGHCSPRSGFDTNVKVKFSDLDARYAVKCRLLPLTRRSLAVLFSPRKAVKLGVFDVMAPLFRRYKRIMNMQRCCKCGTYHNFEY